MCPECNSRTVCDECINVDLQMAAEDQRINISSGEDAFYNEDQDARRNETRTYVLAV